MTDLEARLKNRRQSQLYKEDELIELREYKKTDFIPVIGWAHYVYRTNLSKNEPDFDMLDIEIGHNFGLALYNIAISIGAGLIYYFS